MHNMSSQCTTYHDNAQHIVYEGSHHLQLTDVSILIKCKRISNARSKRSPNKDFYVFCRISTSIELSIIQLSPEWLSDWVKFGPGMVR